jgi:hypothetical protein
MMLAYANPTCAARKKGSSKTVLFAGMLILAGAPAQAASPYAFKVDITLSPKAATKLAELHESVVGAAYFYGLPTKAARKHADDVGQIHLNSETVTVESDQRTIAFSGKDVRRKEIAWVKKRQVMVAVNVYSARRSAADNILHCDIYQGLISAAQSNTPTIACRLIHGE